MRIEHEHRASETHSGKGLDGMKRNGMGTKSHYVKIDHLMALRTEMRQLLCCTLSHYAEQERGQQQTHYNLDPPTGWLLFLHHPGMEHRNGYYERCFSWNYSVPMTQHRQCRRRRRLWMLKGGGDDGPTVMATN